MPLRGVVLIPGETGWQVGTGGLHTVDLPADASPEVVAVQVAAALQTAGYRGEDVILAIPGTSCLAASFDVSRNRRRDALALQLEEQLPIAAEEFVADFVDHGDRTLGIAGRLAMLSPMVMALESQQVHVAHVVPLALLALQGLGLGVEQAGTCVLWQQGMGVDVIWLRDGRLVGWAVVPADPRVVAAEVARMSLDRPVGSIACHLGASIVQALQEQGWPLNCLDREQATAALAAAERIVGGAEHPIVDLRRDALAAPDPFRRLRGSVNVALAAAIVFLCVTGIAMLVRASRYQRVGADSEAQQAVVFQQAFPNAPVPVNIRARLEAEYRSVGTSGAQADTSSQPAVVVLRDLLSHVPSSTKVDLSRVAISGKRFRLEGSVAAADEAAAISSAVGSAAAGRLEPVSVQAAANGAYSFVIQSAAQPPTTVPAAGETP